MKKYVVARHGSAAWSEVVAAAGMTDREFLPNHAYPDADAARLVNEASRRAGQPAAAVLEDFGEFIAPDLLAMYKTQVDPAWKTLDVIEHTEEIIHRVVRMQIAGAKPPELICKRDGPRKLRLTYRSARRMCGMAKGLVRGIAKEYGEGVEVSEQACMHQGAPACELVVRMV